MNEIIEWTRDVLNSTAGTTIRTAGANVDVDTIEQWLAGGGAPNLSSGVRSSPDVRRNALLSQIAALACSTDLGTWVQSVQALYDELIAGSSGPWGDAIGDWQTPLIVAIPQPITEADYRSFKALGGCGTTLPAPLYSGAGDDLSTPAKAAIGGALVGVAYLLYRWISR